MSDPVKLAVFRFRRRAAAWSDRPRGSLYAHEIELTYNMTRSAHLGPTRVRCLGPAPV